MALVVYLQSAISIRTSIHQTKGDTIPAVSAHYASVLQVTTVVDTPPVARAVAKELLVAVTVDVVHPNSLRGRFWYNYRRERKQEK